jgi:hypothetical protein
MKLLHYETVFEIGLRSFPWGGLLHPAIAIVIGVPLFLFAKSKELYRLVGGAAALFGALLVFIMAIELVPEYISLRRAYVKGDSSVVEGVVENFHPAPALGAAGEYFSVSGVVFTYDALESTPCFHNAPYRKGPIRPGMGVRIYYRNNCIQKMDIRK